MTPRHLLMIAGVAGAAWLAFFADKTPSAGIAEPVVRAPIPSASVAAATPAKPQAQRVTNPATRDPAILALLPRDALIGGAHASEPGAGLFAIQSWTPPPPPPPKPPPPPPPTAPPLPFTYIGKKSEDSRWEVYLAKGEQTLIVREQTVIDDMYRVDTIKPPTLTLTYLPLKQVQTLTIGGSD